MRRRPIAVLVAGLAGAAPLTSAAAQAVGPSITHRDVVAQCGAGDVLMQATEQQDLPAGSAVVVTDTVTEAGATRELSSNEVPVAVPVQASLAVTHDVLFRSVTGTAVFTLVRVTRVYVGEGSASGTPAFEEELTMTCNGPGLASVTVRTSRIGTVPPSEPARPVSAQPRFTG